MQANVSMALWVRIFKIQVGLKSWMITFQVSYLPWYKLDWYKVGAYGHLILKKISFQQHGEGKRSWPIEIFWAPTQKDLSNNMVRIKGHDQSKFSKHPPPNPKKKTKTNKKEKKGNISWVISSSMQIRSGWSYSLRISSRRELSNIIFWEKIWCTDK